MPERLGYVELHVQDDGVHYGAEDLDDFAIYRGSPVTTASHVAFAAEDCTAVDLFFSEAVSNVATVRGEPGVWTQYSDRYYAAFRRLPSVTRLGGLPSHNAPVRGLHANSSR